MDFTTSAGFSVDAFHERRITNRATTDDTAPNTASGIHKESSMRLTKLLSQLVAISQAIGAATTKQTATMVRYLQLNIATTLPLVAP